MIVTKNNADNKANRLNVYVNSGRAVVIARRMRSLRPSLRGEASNERTAAIYRILVAFLMKCHAA
jgi:hypothetical protein